MEIFTEEEQDPWVSSDPCTSHWEVQIQYLGALCMLPLAAGITDNCESPDMVLGMSSKYS